jgi:hypothetical protein
LLDKHYRKPDFCNRVKVLLAVCDGKKRLVTIPSSDQQQLGPLHTAIYDHISRYDWLLRGEADPSGFPGFQRKRGECFVSGDYESATDNLKKDVARHILNLILRQCTRVPLWVRDAAMSTLECDMFTSQGREVKQERGQLMGNYICFPLLCLQNYLAFKYHVRRDVPVRINGDDIVFRARPDEVSRWKAGVLSAGLKLSPGKTSISDRWFSLNSTFFQADHRSCRLVPIVRSTHLFKPVESISAIGQRINDVGKGFGPVQRGVWQLIILQQFRTAVYRLQRSVRRGLGCKIARWVLEEARMWDRERFYLSLPEELPLPTVCVGYKQEVIPPGWRRVERPTQEEILAEREFYQLLVERAWTEKFVLRTQDDEWILAREGTFSCQAWFKLIRSPRMARLFGLYKSSRWLKCKDGHLARWVRKSPGVKCWVRKVEVEVDEPVIYYGIAPWDESRYMATLMGL